MRCYRKLLNSLYKDHVTDEEVRRKVKAVIGEYVELLAFGKKRKLGWFGHASRYSKRKEKKWQTEEDRGSKTMPAQLGQLKTGRGG